MRSTYVSFNGADYFHSEANVADIPTKNKMTCFMYEHAFYLQFSKSYDLY